MYIGSCEGSALKTFFQTIHFNYTPIQYAFLPGLMEIYKSKLGTHLTNSSLLVSVSIRFTYLIQESSYFDSQLSLLPIQHEALSTSNYDAKSLQEIEIIDPSNEKIYPDIKNLAIGSLQECIE